LRIEDTTGHSEANVETASLPQSFSNAQQQHSPTPAFHGLGGDGIATLELQKTLLIARVLELQNLLRRYQIEVPFCDPYLKSILDHVMWIQA
jgi:hypothetical protein